MRIPAALAAVLLLAGLASAQTMIPIPAFNRTYSYSAHTRGFYCQAPVDFTVVGLRVPDEANNGQQNVCVYQHTAAPLPISTAVPLTPVFSKFGEPSRNIIPCSIPYKKGDWLIVLGACGNASMLHNSYGPQGCFQSSIFGQPTTICRGGVQANIVSTAPPHTVWSENAFEVCRVEVYVASAQLVGSGSGAPGTALTFTLMAAADGGLPYQLGSSLGNGPIPIDTRKLELSADALLVASVSGNLPAVFEGYAGTLDAKGLGNAKLHIPMIPALKGLRIYSAFVTLRGSAPSGIASISDTFLFTIQ
ncbi:MAG: hypothetical protein JXQ29_04690 [Planctomycetes bacterium]|nr:hypothetical protein [Planctomycetota bacterium]